MGFNKYGTPMQVRPNVADALSIRSGERVIAPSGRNGSVVETSGLTLLVLFDGDDAPSTIASTEVRRTS